MMKVHLTRNLIRGFIFLICFFSVSDFVYSQSGTVFRDYNVNGIRDTNEPLSSGIIINAYNSSGSLCASDTSSGITAPNYLLPTTCTGNLRLEFIIPNTNSNPNGPSSDVDFTSYSGTTYGTSVQFVSAGATNVNFAFSSTSDFCQVNPKVVTNCYIGGNQTGTQDALVSFPYSSSGTAPVITYEAKANEIGTTWGIAYNKSKNILYTAAFVKRHAGLGTSGIGAIYTVDPTGIANPSLFIDVETLQGVDVGTIGTNAARGLGAATATSIDAETFAKVGKEGLGDIDVSDDGRTLYVMNLFQKTVLEIDVETKTLKNQYTIPDPGCEANGTFRPFGTKIYRGYLYVGVVCSGESSGVIGNFSVMKLTGSTFSTVLTGPLNYPKGFVHAQYTANPTVCDNFESWTDVFSQLSQAGSSSSGPRWCRPQPMLSDIEFDVDGSMILGFMDRTGHQTGYAQPNTTNTATGNGYIGGDILRAYNNNGTYVLENAGTTLIGGGCGNNGDGPGGGEFYCGERYPATGAVTHEETSNGGLVLKPGTGEILLSAMDPGNTIFSGGLIALSNTTGQKTDFVQLYSSTNSSTFGKAAGIGDLELMCDLPPLEIGNRIWNDKDRDGIQDANEVGIANITVEIYDGLTLLGSTITDANGNWFFNNSNLADGSATSGVQLGVQPNKEYLIKVGSLDWVSGNGTAELKNLVLTTSDATSNGLQNISDSDAYLVNSIPTITYTTGDYGQNNHTLDMGFSCVPLLAGSDLTFCQPSNGNYKLNDALAGQTWVAKSGTTSTINASTGAITGLTAGIHEFVLKYTDTSECSDTITIKVNAVPDLVLSVVPATCSPTGGNANNDAKINLLNTNNGSKIDFTSGATYMGIKSFASLPSGIPVGNVIILNNPLVSKFYTVRLFNSDGSCFTDKSVLVPHIECPIVCPFNVCLPIDSFKN